jgi:hypothetical protein
MAWIQGPRGKASNAENIREYGPLPYGCLDLCVLVIFHRGIVTDVTAKVWMGMRESWRFCCRVCRDSRLVDAVGDDIGYRAVEG